MPGENPHSRHTCVTPVVVAAVVLAGAIPALGVREKSEPGRFDSLLRSDPSVAVGTRPVPVDHLLADDPLRRAWTGLELRKEGGFTAWIDERSGLPALAIGRGLPWIPGAGNALTGRGDPTIEELERLARHFTSKWGGLLGRWDGQLTLDREASGRTGDAWLIAFRQVVRGVPVQGARFDFHVSHGNLVAFGATRWAPVVRSTRPGLTQDEARQNLIEYLGSAGSGESRFHGQASLVLLPVDPGLRIGEPWEGPRAKGYKHLLVWRFVFDFPGEAPNWVAMVDSDTGDVVALFDDNRYGRIKGGVYPWSNEGDCPDGCEQAAFPMPFVDYSEDGSEAVYTGGFGLYECSASGSNIRTTLTGRYVEVVDVCGSVDEQAQCPDDLDLSFGTGTNCAVPSGGSAGNTHAARTSFYHLNRMMQKGRAWLSANGWVTQPLTSNVNIHDTCDAFWDSDEGTVNFLKSEDGCGNTGELAGIVQHEWGHGLDFNDGGGSDSPAEAYADIVAFLESRDSCVGPGFYLTHSCYGFGDACLDCTGVRDHDWDEHAGHAPVNAEWVQAHCWASPYAGPCGQESHCEGHMAAQAVWDLAARDLTGQSGRSADAWQVAERLFYLSRPGSGGDAYNCALPDVDGCSATSWFHRFRLIDDEDGDLDNGTPHGAAIFAAFDRHDIACGAPSDSSNQSHSSCPTLEAPMLTATPLANKIRLDWDRVPNAAAYLVLRNDFGCDRGSLIVNRTDAPAMRYDDGELANDFTVYYRVQPRASNDSCAGPVSNCVAVASIPCIDADADGFGAPGDPLCVGDCDDEDPTTYPDAPEINDGKDNQCPGDPGHGLVDEVERCGFEDPQDRTAFSWTPQPGATLYEVALSTTPSFSAPDCTTWTEQESGTTLSDDPPQGQVSYILVRTVQPNVGSWGADSAGVERTVACSAD
jgi:hypothetical protein